LVASNVWGADRNYDYGTQFIRSYREGVKLKMEREKREEERRQRQEELEFMREQQRIEREKWKFEKERQILADREARAKEIEDMIKALARSLSRQNRPNSWQQHPQLHQDLLTAMRAKDTVAMNNTLKEMTRREGGR